MPPNVEEFSSVRFLAILWVVCRHMSDPFNPTWIPGSDRASPLPIAATYRVGVAVDLFVTLSGFVMAYVYAERSVLSGGLASLGTFYLKRFDRVLLVTWLSFGLALMMSSSNSSAAENAACFLLANTWVPHPFMCFEGGGASPSWTISALTAHWLLYTVRSIRLACARQRKLAGLLGLPPNLVGGLTRPGRPVTRRRARHAFVLRSLDSRLPAGTVCRRCHASSPPAD
jgi:peptidoglycan/LPS O-acetylase OafA/YrhL